MLKKVVSVLTVGSIEVDPRASSAFRVRLATSRLLVACLLVIGIASAVASGQTPNASRRVAGVVVDQTGAAVSGAKVVVARAANPVGQTESGADGSFSFTLPADRYTLSISAPGFNTSTEPVDLSGGDREYAALVLNISASAAIVTISGDQPYAPASITSATKTSTPLLDVPQSVSVVKREQIADQMMTSIADVVRYVPGVTAHQGENNRDDVVIRGNRSSADFYRDGVRDDVQYYRDLYNLESVEALKGPNAMAFGRGGGGGVINRVTKEAGFAPHRAFSVNGGSNYNRRLTGDIGQPLGKRTAFRLNGVYENSDSFRKFVRLNRVGLNPTFTFLPDAKTRVTVSYEFFRDRRTADRGITSFQGRPAEMPISTFYGDPEKSRVAANVNIVSGSIDRVFGNLIFRNRTNYGDYDRFYQNYVPGTVNAAKTLVTLTAYNNATRRRNFFNQTDLIYSLNTGRIKHTIVGGTEFGDQLTTNFRMTGYFNNVTTSYLAPYSDPEISVPITFRQSATDANNHLRLGLGAAYIQDQIEISRYIQVTAGVRFDYFGLKYFNDRTGEHLRRIDRLVSPRFGVVLKPFAAMSIYGSYSMSHLPSSGDQFASLTTVTQQVKPERFTNYEVGAKWDIRRGLSVTAAAYRLDRSNTRSTDPNNPLAIIQTGKQRSEGFEAGLTGSLTRKWIVSGGYAYQNARITSATAAALAGKQVGQVPHNTLSLWNKYAVTNKLSAGLGLVYRSDMFAAVDNTVILPGYVKADAALFYNISENWRLQAHFENITNVRYYANADSNTNITPGTPRGVKVGLTARF